jgi:hypothetical protein
MVSFSYFMMCRVLLSPPFERDNTTSWAKDRLKMLVIELKHTNCIPLLLAACKLSAEQFAEIVQIVERFAFRYKIISNEHITPLQNVYYSQAVLIRRDPSHYSVNSLKSALRGLTPRVPGTIFLPNLEKLVYNKAGGNKPIKYLLLSIECYWTWFERGAHGEPKCIDQSVVFDFSSTTIEHIYPESASATGIDTSLEPLKHTLGNLTVMGSGPNRINANDVFSIKKPIFASNNLLINHHISENNTWSETEITAWKQKIVDIAKKIFVENFE